MQKCVVLCPHQHSLLPLSCSSSNVCSDQPGDGRLTQWLSLDPILGPSQGFATLLKMIYLLGFDSSSCPTDCWSTDSLRTRCQIFLLFCPSELWQSMGYPLSGLSYSLISDAYPETFEVPFPSKPDEESVFSGLTPPPNEALNLLLQQNLMSTFPTTCYMMVRRGLGHPASV